MYIRSVAKFIFVCVFSICLKLNKNYHGMWHHTLYYFESFNIILQEHVEGANLNIYCRDQDGWLVGCGLTSHSTIFQLYSDRTVVQFPNFPLLLGTRRHGQLGVFSVPTLILHEHRDVRRGPTRGLGMPGIERRTSDPHYIPLPLVIKKNIETIPFGVNTFQKTNRAKNSKIFLNMITYLSLKACQILILRSING